jgi:hypothetical protein
MIIDDVQSVGIVLRVFVKQFAVLVNFPEDNLSVKSATDDSIFGVVVKHQYICLMAVMRVHVHHFADVPNFQTPVIRSCVKLIVLFVKLDPGNCVSMSHESLDLLLVVKVPDTHDSIFSSRHKVFTVWRNCASQYFIEVALHCSIELFSFEEHLFLTFDIPHD